MSDTCLTVEQRQCLEQSAYLESSFFFVRGLTTETGCRVGLDDGPRGEMLKSCRGDVSFGVFCCWVRRKLSCVMTAKARGL